MDDKLKLALALCLGATIALPAPTLARIDEDECDGDDPACECRDCMARGDDRRSLDRYFNSPSR